MEQHNRLPRQKQLDHHFVQQNNQKEQYLLDQESSCFASASLMNLRSDPYRKIIAMNKDKVGNHFVSSPGQLLNAPRQSLATRGDNTINYTSSMQQQMVATTQEASLSQEAVLKKEDEEEEEEKEKPQYHHQRCESGSTGYYSYYPEQPSQGATTTQIVGGNDTQENNNINRQNNCTVSVVVEKPKKRVQFRNVATEPDLCATEFNETSIVEQEGDSHGVSREDTMVEHSVAVNEEANEKADYLQAIQSAMLDQEEPLSNHQHHSCPQSSEQKCGEECSNNNLASMAGRDGSSGGGGTSSGKAKKNNFMGCFSQEEDQIIEKTLLQIRDRIRNGQPLSHQLAQNQNQSDQDCKSESQMYLRTSNYRLRLPPDSEYSREEEGTSENVKSSGMVERLRVSKIPIGAKLETTESSTLGMALSSKPSHKNNNLSKKEIFAMHPKQALSLMLMGHNQDSNKKASPAGILKQPKMFSGEQSIDSIESHLEMVRKQFKQPSLPASRRQEARIHSSVTYSPVSHCITRDAANIFEKKKQRMAKIQKLRDASNQSEADAANMLFINEQQSNQIQFGGIQQQVDDVQNTAVVESRNSRQKNDLILQLQQQKKQPTSLPQTPRDPFLNKLILKVKQADQQTNPGVQVAISSSQGHQKNSKTTGPWQTTYDTSKFMEHDSKKSKGTKRATNSSQACNAKVAVASDNQFHQLQPQTKAPPVTHAHNSVQKKKTTVPRPRPQDYQQHLINFYLQQQQVSESSLSIGDRQSTMIQKHPQQKRTTMAPATNSTTSSKPKHQSSKQQSAVINKLLTEVLGGVSSKNAAGTSTRPKSTNTNAAMNQIGSQGRQTKPKFHTERSNQELGGINGANSAMLQYAIDPVILRKLKALGGNQNQQSLIPDAKSTSCGNAGILSKESSSQGKKQRNNNEHQHQRMSGKQAPTSKFGSHHSGVSQLISNFIIAQSGKKQATQTTTSASLLQKEQILFLLEHLTQSSSTAQQKEGTTDQAVSSKTTTSHNVQSSSQQYSKSQRSRYNSGPTTRKTATKIERHQRCESGSTGYSYPEPPSTSVAAPSENLGTLQPPRTYLRHDIRVDTAAAVEKPKKRVQFRNVATEPDLCATEFNETSIVEQEGDSHGVSREDTMVEHSVAVNEEANEKADYLQAIQSAMLDQCQMSVEAEQRSGECQVQQESDRIFGGKQQQIFTAQEELLIEKTLMQIRDRIRSGLPLSHQVNQQYSNNNDADSEQNRSNSQQSARIKISQCEYSRDEGTSENVKSSGMVEKFRVSKIPIGADKETIESSSLGMALSSKPSHKNNNLSKKEIFAMHPKQALSLMCNNQKSRKSSPAGILKQPKMFSGEQSIDSIETHLEMVRKQFKQPSLPASRRQEARIHSSVTYSPVSHCITRDAANIFEKKKQRMAKIQKLRDVSNQSEANRQILICSSAEDLHHHLHQIDNNSSTIPPTTNKLNYKHETTSSLEHHHPIKKSKLSSQVKQQQSNQTQQQHQTQGTTKPRKHPISQPLTPRKFTTIENIILQKLTQAAVVNQQQQQVQQAQAQSKKSAGNAPSKKHALLMSSKAPPVTGQNSNAHNSNQKKNAPDNNNAVDQKIELKTRVSSAVSDQNKTAHNLNHQHTAAIVSVQPPQQQKQKLRTNSSLTRKQQRQCMGLLADHQNNQQQQQQNFKQKPVSISQQQQQLVAQNNSHLLINYLLHQQQQTAGSQSSIDASNPKQQQLQLQKQQSKQTTNNYNRIEQQQSLIKNAQQVQVSLKAKQQAQQQIQQGKTTKYQNSNNIKQQMKYQQQLQIQQQNSINSHKQVQAAVNHAVGVSHPPPHMTLNLLQQQQSQKSRPHQSAAPTNTSGNYRSTTGAAKMTDSSQEQQRKYQQVVSVQQQQQQAPKRRDKRSKRTSIHNVSALTVAVASSSSAVTQNAAVKATTSMATNRSSQQYTTTTTASANIQQQQQHQRLSSHVVACAAGHQLAVTVCRASANKPNLNRD